MEKRGTHPDGAKYLIPEMATFGKGMEERVLRHTGESIDGHPIVPTQRQAEKHLESLSEFVVEAEEGSGEPWGDAHETLLERFVQEWPATSESLIDATFAFYKENYESLFGSAGGRECDRIILPQPIDRGVIVDLFTLGSITLSSESECVGISGTCTWDEEHGFGAVVRGGEVVEIGGAAIAYAPSSYDPDLDGDDGPWFATDNGSYDLIWDGEFELTTRLRKPIREHLVRTMTISGGKRLNGIHALIVAACSNANVSGVPYSMADIESHYGGEIDFAQYSTNVQKHSNEEQKNLSALLKMLNKHGGDASQIAEIERQVSDGFVLPRSWDSYCMLNAGKIYCPS